MDILLHNCLIKVFSETHRWAELEKLAKSKKSPIGYAAFVEACATVGAPEEADRFLSRVESDRRVRCLFLLNRYQEAVTAAQKSEDDLRYLMTKFQLEERRCREDSSRNANSVNSYRMSMQHWGSSVNGCLVF